MAKQVITVLTDDLDGGTAHHTVQFALDGVHYTIDLSEKNAGKLRKALDAYISAGTRIGRGGIDARSASRRRAAAQGGGLSREQNRAIREWAVEQGYEISDRGRIPSSVVEAFNGR